MTVTSYLSINGELVGEEIVGGSATDYAADALGSTTSTIVGTSIENSYFFKPFGSQLAKVGTGPDPAFLWVGSQGYKTIESGYASHYVRTRHYSSASSRWSTRDQLWPKETAFAYASNNPTLVVDPTGRFGVSRRQDDPVWKIGNPPGPCNVFSASCGRLPQDLVESLDGALILGCTGCCLAQSGGAWSQVGEWQQPAPDWFGFPPNVWDEVGKIMIPISIEHETIHNKQLNPCCGLGQTQWSKVGGTNLYKAVMWAYMYVDLVNYLTLWIPWSECSAWGDTIRRVKAAISCKDSGPTCCRNYAAGTCDALQQLLDGVDGGPDGLLTTWTDYCDRSGLEPSCPYPYKPKGSGSNASNLL